MKNSELFQFSAQCLALKYLPEQKSSIIEIFRKNSFPKDKFIRMCSNQLILPAVWLNFTNLQTKQLYPTEYQIYINNIVDLNRNRNHNILKQINKICQILLQKNIEPVFMKGTAHLLGGLYSDLCERLIGDIDFLVPEEEYLRAAELLKQAGYFSTLEFYGDLKKLKHYPRLIHNNVEADIEIHRKPVNIDFSNLLSAKEIYKNRIKLAHIENCYIPSAQHQLLQNFIHSQLSNRGHSYIVPRLRDLYDAYLLLNKAGWPKPDLSLQTSKMATEYFRFAETLFKIPNKPDFQPEPLFSYKKRFDFFCNNPRIHLLYIDIQKLKQLIFDRYLKILLQCLYCKEARQYVYCRLISKKWYRLHFFSLIKSFREN